MMLCLGTVYSWSVFRVALEHELGVSSFYSGLPYMISLATYAVFMVLTGRVIPKYSPRLILMVGAIFVGIGYGLSGFFGTIQGITFAFGILAGGGVGIMYGVPLYTIAQNFPQKSGLINGLVLAGFGLSPLITAPIVKLMITDFGVLSTFKILGMVGLVLLSLLSLGFDNSSSGKAASANFERPLGDFLQDRRFRTLFLLFFLGTFIGLSVIGLTKGAGLTWYQLNANQMTWFVSIFAIFNGLGRLLFGMLTDRLGPKFVMRLSLGSILMVALALSLSPEKSSVLFFICFATLWLNLGGWMAIAPTTTLKLFGRADYSRNYGFVFLAYGLGALLGVSVTGLMIDHFGYPGVPIVIAALSAIGLWVTYRWLD